MFSVAGMYSLRLKFSRVTVEFILFVYGLGNAMTLIGGKSSSIMLIYSMLVNQLSESVTSPGK